MHDARERALAPSVVQVCTYSGPGVIALRIRGVGAGGNLPSQAQPIRAPSSLAGLIGREGEETALL